MHKLFTGILVILVLTMNASFAQTAGEKRMAEDVLFFLMNVEWPDKVLDKDVFTIGIVDKDNQFAQYLKTIIDHAEVHDLPVNVFRFNEPENVIPCHVIIVSKSRNRKIDEIYDHIKKDGILLISHRGKAENLLMIDYSDPVTGAFNMNVDRIQKAGLKVSDEFLSYSLGDITLQQLYYHSKHDLASKKQTVQTQHSIIKKRKGELDSLINEINQRNLVLREKQQEINIQTERLQSLSERLRTQQVVILLALLTVFFLSLTLFLLYKNFTLKTESNIKLKAKNDAILQQKQEIENKNAQITDSINYAQRIQGSILIPEKELMKAFGELFIYYIPRDIVSGDFYWFSEQNEGYVIATVDCTGHGVPGAFMSMIGNTLLNQIVKENNVTDPAKILHELHYGILKSLNHKGSEHDLQDGMDATILFVNKNKNQAVFSAANQSIYVVKDDDLKIMTGDRITVGDHHLDEDNLKNGLLFTNKEFVPLNAALYMFSDGYVDQFGGPENKKYNLPNFKKFILDNYSKPMSKQKELFDTEFKRWKSNHPQIDDVMVLGFRIS